MDNYFYVVADYFLLFCSLIGEIQRDFLCKPDIYLGSRFLTSMQRWKLNLCSLHVQIYFAFLAAKEASKHHDNRRCVGFMSQLFTADNVNL